MNLRKLFRLPCRHKKMVMRQELSHSSMHIPGKSPRDILLRVLYVNCSKCKRTIGVFPRGVAEDKKEGIFKDSNEPMKTEEVEVPSNVRRELLRS